MTGNKFNGITYFLKGKRSLCALLLAMIFLSTTSIAAYALQVETPTANPSAGTYGAPQNIELKTETVAASVYYTTDNTVPTTTSTLYTNLIEVSSNMTIKAIAVKDGMDNSSVSTFEYVLFAGGDGSEDNPYQVATAEQLNNVRYHLDKHFIQTEDINLGVEPYNTGAGWEPIGSDRYPFTGTFDGKGNTISNLTIDRITTNYVGLFGFAEDSHIKNVKLEDVNVIGDYQVGGLVGDNKYGEITNSYATGAVTGTNYVGGLVGYNYWGTITCSYATGAVDGNYCVGGLVAYNDCGEITNSYATSAVTGTEDVGGLVGENWGTITCSYATGAVTGTGNNVGGLVGENNYGEIINSYATGAVTGTNYVGGLVGWNSDSTISYAYATGAVKGTTDVGGLVGINDQGTVSNSYWDTTTSGTVFSAGGEGVAGKSTEDMKLQGTYVDWDFTDIWNIEDSKNDDYPFLKNNPPGSFVKSTITVADVTGGTATVKTNPAPEAAEGLTVTVSITNIEAGKRFKSITVIDIYNEAVTTTTVTAGKSYTFNMPANDVTVTVEVEPILFAGGIGTEEDPYQVATAVQLDSVRYLLDKHFKQTADIDLSSYKTGLGWEPIGDWDSQFIGAFDGKGNTISNLTINRSTRDYVGLFGFAEGAQIKNVKLESVNVTGSEGVGGLVGINIGAITNSYATGAVAGVNYYVGGLVGWNYGEITNSYASGTITGTEDVGGLVGRNDGEITNSYAFGTITGTECVGGLVGYNDGEIANSYGTGAVAGDVSVGGLVGKNRRGNVSNSYWDTTTSGTASSAGGEGKTTAEMKQQETYEGWDFIDIWNIKGTRNNGYPFLKNNPPDNPLTITASIGGTITIGSSGNYAAGTVIDITATPASGYSFNKWISTGGGTFANANNASTTYTMPTNPATITATFTPTGDGSGGGSSGGSSDSTTPSETQVTCSGRTISQNGVTITFPAGAVESDIRVQVKETALSAGMTLPDNSQLLSHVVDIVKDKSGNFLKPVTITLSFDNSGLDPDEYDIAIYYYDEDTGKWIALDNIRLNINSGTVSGDTNHFTKFAVIATPKTIKKEKPAKPVTPQPIVNIPTDISGHWAKDSIIKLINAGVISGYPDGTFKPDKAVTRAEFTVMIVKALNLETRVGKTFADTASHWAKDSIATAAAHGIISGYDENTFGPDDLITREQAAVIISLAAQVEAVTGELNFTDSKAISPWAQPGVATAFKSGFISGYPDGSFKPQGNTTRAEAVSLILKAI